MVRFLCLQLLSYTCELTKAIPVATQTPFIFLPTSRRNGVRVTYSSSSEFTSQLFPPPECFNFQDPHKIPTTSKATTPPNTTPPRKDPATVAPADAYVDCPVGNPELHII